MDEDPIFEFVDTDWTDDKKIEYFKECFLDDIYTLQNQSELFDYLEVELG